MSTEEKEMPKIQNMVKFTDADMERIERAAGKGGG